MDQAQSTGSTKTSTTGSAMLPQATQVLVSADMIEDYNNAMLPPCNGSVSSFCAVTNKDGLTELVTVSDQGELLWLYPDASIPTGWNQVTTAFLNMTGTPSNLCAFYNPLPDGEDEALIVFYNTSPFGASGSGNTQAPYAGMQCVDGAWAAVSLVPDAAAFLTAVRLLQSVQVQVDDVTMSLVYGINVSNRQFFIIGQVLGSAAWTVWSSTLSNQSSGEHLPAAACWWSDAGLAVLLNTAVDPSTPSTPLMRYTQFYAATLDGTAGSVTLSKVGEQQSFPSGTGAPAEFIFTIAVPCSTQSSVLSWQASGAVQQLINENGLVQTNLTGGSGQPGSALAFAAGMAANGLLVAFAIEAGTNLLWMLLQSDSNGNGDFGSWIALGDYGIALGVPPTMSVPQVVIYDDEGNIDLLSQTASGSWFTNAMASPIQSLQTYPACNGGPQTFCTVLNPTTNAAELLTINAQGQLLWLAAGPSGWTQMTAGFQGSFQQTPPTWLCAFYATPGAGGTPILTVFYGSIGAPGYGIQYDGIQWSSVSYAIAENPLLLPQLQPLQFVQTGSSEYPVVLVYGVTAVNNEENAAYFLGPQSGTTDWSLYYQGDLTAYTLQQPYLYAGIFPGSRTGLVFCDTNSHGSQDWLAAEVDFTTGSMPSVVSLGATSAKLIIPARQVVSVPCAGSSGSYSLLVVDAYQHLTNYTINGSQPGAQSLSGASGQPREVTQLGLTYGTDGSLYAFALDPTTQDVSFLQQRAQTGTGTFTWAPIGNFGAPLLAIAASPVMSNDPQLFVLNQTGDIVLVTFTGPPQANTDQSWSSVTIAGPYLAPAPLNPATTYTVEFTAADANGNPVANTVLSIEPDTPQTLVVNNIAYPASPGAPVLGVSDAFGRVTVAALARALASPELTVNICGPVSNSGGPKLPVGTFRADLPLHNRMAGNDPTFPVDQDAYVAAGLLPSGIDSATAGPFCSNMQLLAQGAVNMATNQPAPAADDANSPVRAFVFDFSTRGTLGCRDLTAAELAAHRARRPADDSIFSQAWGDVAHFFKKTWQDVKLVSVEVGDDITVAINGAETYVMQAIDDIRDAIEVVLQALNNVWNDVVDFVVKAIDWLKALFNWQDIINTKNVLKYFFQQNMANLQQVLASSELQTFINAQFANIKGDADEAFTQLESVFSSSATLNSIVSAGSPPTSPMLVGPSPPLQAAPLNQTWSAQSMRINYVTSKIGTNLPSGSGAGSDALAGMTVPASLTNLITIVESVYEQNLPAIEAGAQALAAQIQSIESLSDFLDTAIYGFLFAAQDSLVLAISVVQAVLDLILELAAAALAEALAWLDQDIDIPVISTLYQKMTGSPLTILDLMCLVLATPCTILYKIFYGGSTADPPFTSAQVQAFCSSPVTWPWFGSTAASVRPGPDLTAPDNSALLAIRSDFALLGVIVGFVTMVSDGIGDICNMQNYLVNVPEADKLSDTQLTVVALTNVVSSFLQTSIYQPWTTASCETPADRWNLANSLYPYLEISVDLLMLVSQEVQTKFLPTWGPMIVTLLGAAQTTVGIITACNMSNDASYSPKDQCVAVMGGLSPFCKAGVYIGKTKSTTAITCTGIGMGICDIVDDAVTPVLSAWSVLSA